MNEDDYNETWLEAFRAYSWLYMLVADMPKSPARSNVLSALDENYDYLMHASYEEERRQREAHHQAMADALFGLKDHDKDCNCKEEA